MVLKSNGLVPIRLRIDVQGLFHSVTNPRKGHVVDVEKQHAARYFAVGIAQPAELETLGEPFKAVRSGVNC